MHGDVLPSNTQRAVARALHALADAHDEFNHKNFAKAWTHVAAHDRQRLLTMLSLKEFREFMQTWFMCDQYVDKMLVRVYDEIHADLNSRHETTGVRLREVFNALSQVMSKSLVEQVEFYFDLFDLDGSGSLDKGEVCRCKLLRACAMTVPGFI